MLDKELERRLKRYGPAGPPAELRAQILDATGAARGWPWAAAAAVLLASTLLLRTGSSAEMNAIREPAPDIRAAAVADLARSLGGTPDARVLAETLLIQQEVRAARAGAPAPEIP